jgi:hypothetical protein
MIAKGAFAALLVTGSVAGAAVDVTGVFGTGSNVRDVMGSYYELGLSGCYTNEYFYDQPYLGYQKEFGVFEEYFPGWEYRRFRLLPRPAEAICRLQFRILRLEEVFGSGLPRGDGFLAPGFRRADGLAKYKVSGRKPGPVRLRLQLRRRQVA